MMRIGIDLGGTKIEGVALDDEGNELGRERVATPRGEYDGTIATIAQVVAALEQRFGGPASVGIGIPGAISPATGVVKNANSTWLNGRAFDRDLERGLKRPIRLANDANCFALSEATDGAAAGSGVVFGVILGTGVGGGIVINSRIVEGAHRIAGEWGHNPLPAPYDDERPGPACYCGRRGCIETFLSGPGWADDTARRTGRRADAMSLADAAVKGDALAREALTRYVDRLARSLATVINVIDPDAIVLGGGLSNISALYEEVPARWGAYVFSDVITTR
ncbi:MAG TPA: ROK family protein, partial [Vicinamibacterales bacterium]|nr:ROK family protein [Vicinamibacterales bacterium]